MELADAFDQRWTFVHVFVTSMLIFVGSCDSDNYDILDPLQRYHLRWTVNSQTETILFRAEVLTKGYVALGLSPNGGMTGSDIAIGWVKDGVAYLRVSNFLVFILYLSVQQPSCKSCIAVFLKVSVAAPRNVAVSWRYRCVCDFSGFEVILL